MRARFYLRTLGPGNAESWWFDVAQRSTIKIGGSAQNQVILSNPNVSRLHAIIALTSKGATLRAIAPVRVNGEGTTNRALRAGDVIEIADARLEVGWGTGDIAAESPGKERDGGAPGEENTGAPAGAALFADEPTQSALSEPKLDRARAFAPVADNARCTATGVPTMHHFNAKTRQVLAARSHAAL